MTERTKTAETTGFVPVHLDGHVDWIGIMIQDDKPDIKLSVGYKWTRCEVRFALGESSPQAKDG